jgi:phage gp45-like
MISSGWCFRHQQAIMIDTTVMIKAIATDVRKCKRMGFMSVPPEGEWAFFR